MPGRGEVLIRILGDSSSLDTALAGTTSKLSAFGSAVTSPAGLATAAAIVVGAALFKMGEDFNNAFIIIRRETGATGGDLNKLEGDFKNVVSTVPAKFGDAAEAVSKLHMVLGLNGGALDRESEQVLELNRVTGGVLSETVAGVTGLFNNWQISTHNQAGALDEVFRASQASGTTISTLMEQLTMSGGTLREMNFSFDQSVAMLASFDKAGLNTQQLMMNFKIGLKTFAKANEEPQQALARLVQEVKDAPTPMEALALSLKVFGNRGGSQFADAVRTGRIDFQGMMDTLKNGKETIRSAGEDTMTLGDKWRLLKNEVFVALQPVASAFFTLILDGVGAIVDGFKSVTGFISDFSDDWRDGTDKAGVGAGHLRDIVHKVWRTITDDVDALKGIWQPVADAVDKAWTAVWNTFKSGSPALSSAKSALGDLKDSIWSAFKDSPTFIRQFQSDWETGSDKAGVSASKIKDALHGVWAWIKQAFSDIKGFINDLSTDWETGSNKIGLSVGKIKTVVHKLWDDIKVIFDAMKAYWTVVFEICAGVIIGFVRVVEDLWTRFGSHILEHVRTTWSNILSFISGVLDIIKGVFDIFAGIFTLDFGRVWNGIKEVVSGVWDAIVALVKESINFLSGLIGLGMAVISEAWGYVWGGIKSVAGEIWGGITGAAGFAMGILHNAIMTPMNALKDAWGAAWGVMLGAAQFIVGVISGLGDGIMGGIKAVWNTIADAINSISVDIDGVSVFGQDIIPGIHIHPHVPTLATGGVLSNPTLAVVGDSGPGNPEIITPEKLMRQIVKDELDRSGKHSRHGSGQVEQTFIFHGVKDAWDAHDRYAWTQKTAGR